MQVQLLFSNIANYVHTADEKWQIIKATRNKILLNVGWVLTSNTLTDIEREAGLDYIQALKDIPQDFVNPDDVVFPTPPVFLENWVNL
jgi:hypothetical protein